MNPTKSSSSSSADVEAPDNRKVQSKSEKDANDPSTSQVQPDGGLHAWFIVLASFLTNGLIFGIHNCYGIIYLRLKAELERSGVVDASTKSAFVGSLSIGMTFLASPLAGILIDSFGLRRTAILGGVIATVGMLASSFALAHVEAMYLTYGILFGVGTSLAYNPSLVILGHYFRCRLGLVNGLVTAGSSVFTIGLPFFLDAVLNGVGLAATLQILSGIMALLMFCAMTFVPLLPPVVANVCDDDDHRSACSRLWSKYVNFSIWKNKKYVIWAIAVPFAMGGYFVPYVHLVAYVKDILPEADGKVLVLCIGVTSGIGRLVFGKIGDFARVNRVVLQQAAFFAIGVFTMLLTLANSFAWLVVICLFMGLFDGCFVALVGPIAFDLCGPRSASQAIGFLLGLYSLPMTTGPTVAGTLYEVLGSYQVPFLLAGCPPIICALIMFLIPRMKHQEDAGCATEVSIKQKKTLQQGDVNGNQIGTADQQKSTPVVRQKQSNTFSTLNSPEPKQRSPFVTALEWRFHSPPSQKKNSKNVASSDEMTADPVSLTGFSSSAILW